MLPQDHISRGIIREWRLVVAILAVIVALAVVNWVQSPEHARRWLGAMLLLPAIAAGLGVWYIATRRARRPTGPGDEQAIRRYFMAALTLAALAIGIRQMTVLGLAIWARIGDHPSDLDVERRILGLSTGVVFVVVGNALPKILTPLAILPLALAERVSRARRFIGTVWVILGLTVMAGHVAAPSAAARTFAGWAAVCGLLTMLGGIVWMNSGARGRATS